MEDEGKAKTDKILEDYYNRHPEEAEKVGTDLIDQQRKADQQEAAIDAVAASGNSPYNNYFLGRFLWLTNISWGKWFLLNLLIAAVGIVVIDVLNLPPVVDDLISVAFVIYLIATRAGRV